MSKKKGKNANPHRGSSLDEFLEEEGILEEATAKAAKKALAWQFAQAMKERNVTKAALARRSTRRDAEALSIISWHRHMHHLYCATGKTECHPHQRSVARPGNQIIG